MMDLAGTRAVLVDALNSVATGQHQLWHGYAPDAPIPPSGWIEALALDYTTGNGYCLARASASLLVVAQRHDAQGSAQFLERYLPDWVAAVGKVPGVQVQGAEIGIATVAGQELPAVKIEAVFYVSS
jgi:hypothetical protein